MSTRPNIDWEVESGNSISIDHAQLAVLMDIRRELRKLNKRMKRRPLKIRRVTRKRPQRLIEKLNRWARVVAMKVKL